MEMTSCQITGIPKDKWVRFRQKCLLEGVSVNQKVRRMIEAEVLLVEDAGECDGCQGNEGEKR